jgi:hypothetical protein
MLSLILLTATMFSPLPPPTPVVTWNASDVSISCVQGDLVIFQLAWGETFVVPIASVKFDAESQEFSLTAIDSPTVLTTTYTDTLGVSHTITTDCHRYVNDDACLTDHVKLTKAMQAIWAPRPPS